jgi:hypothetical protein
MTQSQIVLYTTPDGDIRIDAVLMNESMWLTQGAMAELFAVNVPAVSKHLSNIYEEGELIRDTTISKMETVQDEGGRQGSIVRKQDVAIAKNYLNAEEIKELNEIVTMYLDYAERQARQRKTVTMEQWSEKLDAFLSFNEHELLTHAGKVKAEVARQTAEQRYEEFDARRRVDDALAADKEDLRELEEFEKSLGERNKK